MKKSISVLLGVMMFAVVAQAKVETFKMYPERNASPNPGCDRYTELTVRTTRAGVVAKVQDKISGECQIAVLPNEHTYKMTRIEDSCGSKIYVAADLITDNKLVDNRQRFCEDNGNRMELTETGSDGGRKLYSWEPHVTAR